MLDTMADVILRNARLNARRVAIINEGRMFTHAEHSARIWSLGNALSEGLNLPRGSRIAMLCRNCIEQIEVFGAAESHGFIAVPLNWRLAPPELGRVLADCEPTVIFIETRFRDQLDKALGHGALARPRIISFTHASPPELDYGSLLAQGAARPPAKAPRPDEPAHIVYTSGTTGRPKGVVLSHGTLARAAATLSSMTGALPTDRILIVMPLFHVGAKIEWAAIQYLGGSCVLLQQFDPSKVFAAIEYHEPTMAHLAPVMVKTLVDSDLRTGFDLTSLRRIHYGSAPVPPEELRRATAAFGPIFAQIYGMTENLIVSMLLPYHARIDGDTADVHRLASAGQPFPGVEIGIVGEDGRDVSAGQFGEIVVKSPFVMSGYWRNSEHTRSVFVNGRYRTGDVGRMDDADGFLYVVDRKKDMIISGGENVYSSEVENALLSHPAILEVAVVGIPDAKWGEVVMAYVVVRQGHKTNADDVIAYCRTQIAGYKRPQRVELVSSLPRLPNGKVDKKKLREHHWAGRDRQVS
jgi:acyl-CoA synthetase (AMP-forming)/AMP-acid ligase II